MGESFWEKTEVGSQKTGVRSQIRRGAVLGRSPVKNWSERGSRRKCLMSGPRTIAATVSQSMRRRKPVIQDGERGMRGVGVGRTGGEAGGGEGEHVEGK